MADASDLRRSLRDRAASAFATSVYDTHNDLEAGAPVLTGETRERIRIRIDRSGPSEWATTLESPTKQGEFVERGTAAHTVTARRAQALRFVVGGQVRFAKSVRIPAQPARPWFGPVLAAWPNRLRLAWERLG